MKLAVVKGGNTFVHAADRSPMNKTKRAPMAEVLPTIRFRTTDRLIDVPRWIRLRRVAGSGIRFPEQDRRRFMGAIAATTLNVHGQHDVGRRVRNNRT